MRLTIIAAAVAMTVVASSVHAASVYPASIYPPPVPSHPGHAVALCPNEEGLEPFTASAIALARAEVGRYDRDSLATDLRDSDRAWWPNVRQLWRSRSRHPGSGFGNQIVVGAEPAAQSGYRVFMGPACGARTLARSLMVTIAPSQGGRPLRCDACRSQLFLVDRDGRPLIFYLY